MSAVMYTFLDKLELLLEKGEISEGVYLQLCGVLKDTPMTDSKEDFWREEYHKENQRRLNEEEHAQYLLDVLHINERQMENLFYTVERQRRQLEKYRQDIEHYKTELITRTLLNKDAKKELLDFFQQMGRLSAIPRHRKKAYTAEEIQRMTPSTARLLYNKIFRPIA